MSISQISQNGRKSVSTRRSWTLAEEQCLIVSLKDIVRRGWKCDNGFKTCFLGILEQLMVQAFPGTTIKADPHINSKIHVWKKNYGSLSTMLSRSGFGWNASLNSIEVASDQVWNDFVKADSNARSMRNKSWPFYTDWVEIFGKDRATGENAEGFADVVQELLNNDKGGEHASNGPNQSNYVNLSNDDSEIERSSTFNGEAASTSNSKRGKKRKSNVDMDSQVVELMANFFAKTDEHFSELVRKIGFESDQSSARKMVFDALGKLGFLSTEQKVNVTRVICDKPKDLDLFFSVDDEEKAVIVQMILDSRF